MFPTISNFSNIILWFCILFALESCFLFNSPELPYCRFFVFYNSTNQLKFLLHFQFLDFCYSKRFKSKNCKLYNSLGDFKSWSGNSVWTVLRLWIMVVMKWLRDHKIRMWYFMQAKYYIWGNKFVLLKRKGTIVPCAFSIFKEYPVIF